MCFLNVGQSNIIYNVQTLTVQYRLTLIIVASRLFACFARNRIPLACFTLIYCPRSNNIVSALKRTININIFSFPPKHTTAGISLANEFKYDAKQHTRAIKNKARPKIERSRGSQGDKIGVRSANRTYVRVRRFAQWKRRVALASTDIYIYIYVAERTRTIWQIPHRFWSAARPTTIPGWGARQKQKGMRARRSDDDLLSLRARYLGQSELSGLLPPESGDVFTHSVWSISWLRWPRISRKQVTFRWSAVFCVCAWISVALW